LDWENAHMNRFRIASEKLSSARRHLITQHPEGEYASLLAALRDVEAGLEALGDTRIVSNAAASSVDVLKSLVPTLGRPDATFDWSRFAGAVDDLASWLYWAEPEAA
jgi:hypothetical protein